MKLLQIVENYNDAVEELHDTALTYVLDNVDDSVLSELIAVDVIGNLVHVVIGDICSDRTWTLKFDDDMKMVKG